MNQHVRKTAPDCGNDLFIWKNGSQLIVDHHKGHQYRIFIHCVHQIMRVKLSVRTGCYPFDGISALFHRSHGIGNRRMFDCRRHDGFAIARMCSQCTLNRDIVGIGRAAGKVDTAVITSQQGSGCPSGRGEDVFCVQSLFMQGGRISIILRHRAENRLGRRLADFGGRAVIQVNFQKEELLLFQVYVGK